MTLPMTYERREQIRAALKSLPPRPWHWGSNWRLETSDTRPRPILTTGITSDAPEFLFLSFEESGDDEDWYLRSADEIAELGRPNPVGHWIEHGTQYAEELLSENQRLTDEFDCAQSSLDRAASRECELLNEIGQLKAQLAATTGPDQATVDRVWAEHVPEHVRRDLAGRKEA